MQTQQAGPDTPHAILDAARTCLLADGYAGLSTRKIAQQAGVPLSQVHYHFGSKRSMLLALLEVENRRRLDRQATMYAEDKPLWQRYEQACDFLEDDLESGFVRVLQEMIAAGWSAPDIAEAARSILIGWFELLTEVAGEAHARFGGLGPFTPAEVATLIGMVFMGAESMLLLGFDRQQLPIRSSLRRIGEAVRLAETAGAALASAAPAHATPATNGRPRRKATPAMRALEPTASGIAVRDGVDLGWEVFGEGSTTIVLLPTWSIVPSRFWKLQVPTLARRHRVVTFDGRGSGRSGRPVGAAAYTHLEYAADTLAVLDATATETAVLVGFSCGTLWGLQVTADHPDRVLGLVALCPAVPLAPALPERTVYPFEDVPATTDGWAKYTAHHWRTDYVDFLEFFFTKLYDEPHSSKQIEDCIEWGLGIDPELLAEIDRGLDACGLESFSSVCARITRPVLVVQGDEDLIRNPDAAVAIAEATGGSLVTIGGGGHGTPARDPIIVNALIEDFVRTVAPPVARRHWVRASRRQKRALYLSSPIGLGHAMRDVAIAGELRKRHPDLQIDWLAQHPVTKVLAAAGEHVHPASRFLANESAHFEDEAHEHDLHAFQAIRRMDEILVNNFTVFRDVVEEQHYDLVIGDEAWDVDHFLHENPELKRFAFAWMTDFVGWLPMPDGGRREERLTADYNAEMIEQRDRYRRIRDRSIFVGEPADIVPDHFGPDLPSIRAWTEDNFDFCGYVTGFDPVDDAARGAIRVELGYGADERVCIVTVGGSAVGESLLRRTIAAVPLAQRQVDGLRFVVVAGPRIDPHKLPRRAGVSYRSHVPGLYRHLAACDLAVVQGGLTTCMELTANRRPFVYVPLRHHFEQHFHVAHRLQRYGAGRRMDYDVACDPDALAAQITSTIDAPVDYEPVNADGAARAADLLADLL